MNNKAVVALLDVTIRRDANTITPTTVPRHELAILRMMFGKENVQETGEAGEVELDPSGEHERLCAKYGAGKVVKVYGDDGGDRLTELVAREAEKPAKPTKTAKTSKSETAE